jgi:hypothetical protein
VQPELVAIRAAALRALARRKRLAFADSLIGEWREAVLESPVAESPGWRSATMDNYATVRVPLDAGRAGDLVQVRPQRRQGDVLEGALGGDAEPAAGAAAKDASS